VRRNGPIALITDFGLQDPYAGVLKGVIRSINPGVDVIDLCHSIPAGFIPAGSFVLEKSLTYFPAGTVFLAVVDPGVGGERSILLAEAGDRFFIAPDNGLLTPVLGGPSRIFRLERTEFFLRPEPSTFEARDRMAPMAARLAAGAEPDELGVPAGEFEIDPGWQPARRGDGTIDGRVVYIDHFGNVISNIPGHWLFPEGPAGGGLQVRLGGHLVTATASHYADAAPADPFWLIGSHGNLELAVNRGSAAALLGAAFGQPLHAEAKRA
jgi:S-adenosyl-L-methionine hydrolase (adenosine-forming)